MRVKPRCLLLQQLEERGKSAEVQVAKSLPCLYLQGILGGYGGSMGNPADSERMQFITH